MRQSVAFNEGIVVNSFGRKKDIHRNSWNVRGHRFIRDYVIVNESQARKTRVHRGDDISFDHHLSGSYITVAGRLRKCDVKPNSSLETECITFT